MTSFDGSVTRDHGGGLDQAIAFFGGSRRSWIDLSTGINPVPYPVSHLDASDWTALPDQAAQTALIHAARQFWRIPAEAGILAAPGASALIARLPALHPAGRVRIEPPTYNEHAAAFRTAGWQVVDKGTADAAVLVHPNNPDGRCWQDRDIDAPFTIIDESFCDVVPKQSLIDHAARPGRLVLKSFGKFWGLAGLRLGFAIGPAELVGPLSECLGPWPVSGPALRIGATALRDPDWAETTRQRLSSDSRRLDSLMMGAGAALQGGTSLFRLYAVDDAKAWQDRLAQQHLWTRIFPYSDRLIRLGLPPPDGWSRLEQAL